MKTVLFLLLLSPLVAWAQPPEITPADLQRKQSYLLLRDGSVVRGQILRQDSSLITVQKRNRELTFVEADQLVRIMATRPEDDSPTMIPREVSLTRPAGQDRLFVLKDGSQVAGEFIRRDSTMITVRKQNGQLTYFEPELLVRMDTVQADASNEATRTFPNRFSPWLLTGLTAYNPEKGRFYYRNTGLLLNEFQYGITRFWSVGAKFMTPVPYLAYSDAYVKSSQYLKFTPQLITRLSAAISPSFRLSVNASYQSDQPNNLIDLRDLWSFQALVSVGTSQHNVTAGYGRRVQGRQNIRRYSFYRTLPNQSFLTLGVQQKLSPSLTFISDNTVQMGRNYQAYSDARASVSGVLRLDRRRHAFDLGIYTLIHEKPFLWDNERSVRLFPYVGYNLLIGRD